MVNTIVIASGGLGSVPPGVERVCIEDPTVRHLDLGQLPQGISLVALKNCVGLESVRGKIPEGVKVCIIRNTHHISSFEGLEFPSSFQSLRFIPCGITESGDISAKFLCDRLALRFSEGIPFDIFIGDLRMNKGLSS